MGQFDHVGLPTDEKQPVEMYVKDTKVWVTNPLVHPYKVEYLRYEPDSPVTGAVRNLPHFAFRVEDLNEAIADSGGEIVLGPFRPTGGEMRVVFVVRDGAVFEFMEGAGQGDWFRE
jgi:catechol 2,3-dioxygenase-like lactoylglutathione lyase family enzyme